ncbi:MAG TPA: DUF1648 domain-containing protein [Terracidiphilus sp.]|nr:DUF1648 domain-containing protein [Terracidiphilus sp.]
MRKILEVVGLFALGILFWITWSALYGPDRLPDRVPTHFDAAGNPNGWGSPAGMIILPVIAAGVYLLMSVVARFPSAFNYPVRVTPLNRARLQEITLTMIAWIKVEMVCLFAVLQWVFVQSARNSDGRLFPKVLPVFLFLIFSTVAAHLVALFRAAGRGNNAS